ncbi:MAG: DUF120 domain-containing protein [Candidatus Heimdallarchaeota archaeon]
MLDLLILIARMGGLRGGATLSKIKQEARNSFASIDDLLTQAVSDNLLEFTSEAKDHLWITKQGQRELEQVFNNLSTIFAGLPQNKTSSNLSPAIIGGRVESGLAEAAYYVGLEGYSRRFQSVLGYVPFPGTLNIRMVEKKDKLAWNKLVKTMPLIIPEFDFEGRRYGMVHMWHAALIEPNVPSPPPTVIIRPFRSQHSHVFEVLSPEYLRENPGIRDDARIVFRVMISEDSMEN